MKRLMILAPATIWFLCAGCNGGPNKTNIELITNMMDQPAVKSQGWISDEGPVGQMRVPPEHTVARNYTPYPYADDPGAAEKQPNPYAGDMSAETLKIGRKYYDIYCSMCHGPNGAADGSVAAVMDLKPRNLISADAKSYSDGRIFHAISAGKGLMRAYISQIPDPKIRWKIVNYVRSLQK